METTLNAQSGLNVGRPHVRAFSALCTQVYTEMSTLQEGHFDFSLPGSCDTVTVSTPNPGLSTRTHVHSASKSAAHESRKTVSEPCLSLFTDSSPVQELTGPEDTNQGQTPVCLFLMSTVNKEHDQTVDEQDEGDRRHPSVKTSRTKISLRNLFKRRKCAVSSETFSEIPQKQETPVHLFFGSSVVQENHKTAAEPNREGGWGEGGIEGQRSSCSPRSGHGSQDLSVMFCLQTCPTLQHTADPRKVQCALGGRVQGIAVTSDTKQCQCQTNRVQFGEGGFYQAYNHLPGGNHPRAA
ncbi:hypothetical protein WMY93_025379 [Mugilogobius chulae]|uniref:Uncharacterized protein n=1 Tax=Mugilogobius chulae TaxID=88201 RepID=A0AAW0N7V5_9GOBI